MNKNSLLAAAARSLLAKSGTAVVLVLVFAVAASAYTLVFRSGLRTEIPDEFTLTRTTLTYEISPGFQKTILLNLIDIAATERANNEPWGSFFKHREQKSVDAQPSQPTQPSQSPPQAIRTVTNDDLLAIRQRRIESERAYETRRLQLGLPTVAESRRRQAEEEADLREQLRERSFADKQDERYWRTKARDLRTQIATVDNQINYVRGRLNEVDEASLANRSIVTEIYPLWPNWRWSRNRSPNGNPNGQYPNGYPNGRNPYGYPNGQYPNGYPNGRYPNGYPNGQYPYGYPNQNPYGYPQYPYGYPNGQYPNGYPNGPYDDSENSSRERADLTHRMDDLLVKRAGLMAEWQALEDEARDARVPQVWLEP